MKKFSPLLLSVLVIVSSCTKQGTKQITTPAPLSFEIIGKDGKSMVISKKDSITITYIENGVTKSSHPGILKLQVSSTDTATATKYNGLYITDNVVMSDLSSQPAPVRTFNLNLNGVNLGVIYVDYWKYIGSYPQSSSALTFNNVPVVFDSTVAPPGTFLNLLQVE